MSAFHNLAPFVTGLLFELAVEERNDLGPTLGFQLRRQACGIDIQRLHQQVVELLLDAAERDVLAVLRLIAAPERGAAVERVALRSSFQ